MALGSVQGEQELQRLTLDLTVPIFQLGVDTQPEAGVGCQWAGCLGQTFTSTMIWSLVSSPKAGATCDAPDLAPGSGSDPHPTHRCSSILAQVPHGQDPPSRACYAQGGGSCLLAEEEDALLIPKELHVPMARYPQSCFKLPWGC